MSSPGARVACALSFTAVLALGSGQARAAPVKVAYAVRFEPSSWQPLEPRDLEKTIEHAALEVLTASALFQLEARPRAKLHEAKAEYLLLIEGRTVDESETHTSYLTLEPAGGSALGSFRAVESVTLSRLARPAMLAAVESSARKAAQALLAAVKPGLAARSSPDAPAPLLDERPLPWRWPAVQVPEASASRGAQGLYSRKEPERRAALRELTSLALSAASPRHALESCALGHPERETRLGCLRALAPLSRRLAPTQRVVIQVFRQDKEADLKKEATEQMLYFTGLARAEATQAWLESVATGTVYGPLAQLGDVPHLDQAIHRCLQAAGKRPRYQRSKRSCIELLPPLPWTRRWSLLSRYLEETNPDSPYYLEGMGPSEGSHGTDWQWGLEAALEGAPRWEPRLDDILWRRYQRDLSSTALDALAEVSPATELLAQRLLEVVQTAGASRALFGLRRVCKEKPELRGMVRERLAELRVTKAYPKSISEHQLEEVERELARQDRKEAP